MDKSTIIKTAGSRLIVQDDRGTAEVTFSPHSSLLSPGGRAALRIAVSLLGYRASRPKVVKADKAKGRA